jgi:tetratricopeptide (TPR) repeat protein
MIRRRRVALGTACLPGILGLTLSCHRADPPPLEVEYHGCWAVYLPGPVCVLRDTRKMTLWVKTDLGVTVELRAGRGRFSAAREAHPSGRRFVVSVPPGASSLTVRAWPPGGGRSASWSLRLSEPEMPSWWQEINAAQPEVQLRRLEQLRKTSSRREQGIVLRTLYVLYRADDRRAEGLLKLGIAADRAAGCINGEVEKQTALASIYIRQGRLGEARRILASTRLPARAPAISKYQMAYHRGLLADAVGDYRSALIELRRADELAAQVGLAEFRWKVEQILARLLADTGRTDEALDLFRRLHDGRKIATGCDLGDLPTNWGWALLLAREAGEKVADPMPLLEQARKIYDEHDCARKPLNARLNLALAYLQTGRWRDAHRALEEVRALAGSMPVWQSLWWEDLEARLAIAEGHPERALQLYDDLEGLARRAESFDGRFRAALGRAQALLHLKQRRAALAALAEAERRIDEQSWQIPVHEGLDSFLRLREAEATRLYLRILLDEGRLPEAFALARRARARLLDQLTVRDRLADLTSAEQRRWDQAVAGYRTLRDAIDKEEAEAWRLPADQLERRRANQISRVEKAKQRLDLALAGLGTPRVRGEGSLAPPRAGEVILAYHPLPQGWVGFAAHAGNVEIHFFELPGSFADPAALARVLLDPFRAVLERAERVRVLPYGRLRSIDFHALPLAGEPLSPRHLVTYSLDLPARSPAAPPSRPVALLVADPQGNLPAARQEARDVAQAIRTWNPAWALERPLGAGTEVLRRALPRADLFHYAGHGTFAGFSGWDSVLMLANDSRLTLGDVLALSRAPRWVVLSACDAARSSEEAPGEGIGLANAFLLAGAQAVIAANRPVNDRTARDLVHELYRGWQPGMDLPLQFQRAQQSCLRRRAHAADCLSFRLLEP